MLAGPYTPSNDARLWVSYTSTTAGAVASGSISVHCDQTGQTWARRRWEGDERHPRDGSRDARRVVPITAVTVARPHAEVVLVLDRSGSMIEDAGDGTRKVDKLREAARIFVEAMLPGDGLGLVRFDDTAQRLTNVADVGALVTGAGRVADQRHGPGSGRRDIDRRRRRRGSRGAR